MAWKKVSGTLEDFGYGSGLEYPTDNIIYDVEHKRIADVRIPVRDGDFTVNKPFLEGVKAVLKFTPTKEQLDSIYSQLPVSLNKLNRRSYNTADLYMNRIITEGVEEPIEFTEKISPLHKYDKDNYKIEVIFPESLTKPKTFKIDGFNVQNKIDENKYSIAVRICEQAEEEGFKTEVKEFNCFKEACICPKYVERDELTEELKNSPSVDFFAKVYKYSSKESEDLEQKLWLETTPNSLELGVLANKIFPTSGDNLLRNYGMRDIIQSSNIELNPETIINLKESYTTTGYKLGKKILGSIGSVVGYPVGVAVDELNNAYSSLTKSREKKREEQEIAILETLKEGGATQGELQSCIIQVDEQCMLDRYKRNK